MFRATLILFPRLDAKNKDLKPPQKITHKKIQARHTGRLLFRFLPGSLWTLIFSCQVFVFVFAVSQLPQLGDLRTARNSMPCYYAIPGSAVMLRECCLLSMRNYLTKKKGNNKGTT